MRPFQAGELTEEEIDILSLTPPDIRVYAYLEVSTERRFFIVSDDGIRPAIYRSAVALRDDNYGQ